MLSAPGTLHLRAGRNQGLDLSRCSFCSSTPSARSSRVLLGIRRCLNGGQFSGPAGMTAGGSGDAAAAAASRLVILHAVGPRRAGGGGATVTAAAAAAADTTADADGPRVEEPSTALLLSWFACGNRSLFAAQCLVEVLVELYREGRTFGELQLSLKLATQGARRCRVRGTEGSNTAAATVAAASAPGDQQRLDAGEEEALPPLLQGQEEDVLVSWVALVFLTLEELEVPRVRMQQQQQPREEEELAGAGASGRGGDMGVGKGSGSMAAGNTYLRGMLGYVRQTLGMYDEGQTLARVAGLQGLVQQSSGASSPFLVLMQQYTRLVLLTVEVVAAAGLPTVRPLRLPETVLRPSGYSRAFSSSCSAVLEDEHLESPQQQPQQQQMSSLAAPGACPSRGLAVRLLMAFMGAVLGSQWSLDKFVEAVRVAYDQGLAADELFSQLDEQEFVQSGGLLPISGATSTPSEPSAATAAAGGLSATAPDSAEKDTATAPQQPTPQYQITKSLLSTWISLSYMALAQLAVPYPDVGRRLGWAWAGFGDPTEALGMNDFVGNVLRQMAGEDPRTIPSSPDVRQRSDPDLDSDPDAAADARVRVPRRNGALMVRVEDESLPATSTAVRILTQQVALVQAVCRMVMMGD
ncbi:hypothetical protein VaNZ11_005000 [Volvox africanus]|uniref:Uncharacterized protein n=1 Tax=Volvox africanus TaxID=51714 RepID=A0ABQ5RY94_9CHLO|nr:hypothetical protein VaNZ11_005000 [Volvox africanus]